ncbi:MAG: Na+/H+ antiporter NhaA [Nitriliruptorales bacterium]|nr:Na+/H+ antiporter NhaA [Nitriliruptorales bacterium]
MTQTQTQRERDDDRVLPPTWVESHRFVPQSFVQPALEFMRAEASGGILMLVAAVLAIAWANSPLGDSYFALFETPIHITFGDYELHHLSELTVRGWINDALMAIFFFVVGLEIKRELVVGELRDPRAAALPVIGALGGMLVPAAIYLFFNAGSDTASGWGIPMATDIAFAAGVASLMGSRVPLQAKLFLLALAIVDDLGAILVIAVFYTGDLSFGWLLVAGSGLLVMNVMRRSDIRHLGLYGIVGVFIWLAVLESGVHATVAGVAMAFLTPVDSFYDPRRFASRADELVARAAAYLPEQPGLANLDHHTLQRVQNIMNDLQRLARESLPPLHRLEHMLSPWTTFFVVPLFALANAGVHIRGEVIGSVLGDPVFLGVALGLVVGKVAGVSTFAWLSVRLGLARLPDKTRLSHIVGVGFLAGIGFTVALFVSALSFDPGSDSADSSKLGIFAASIVAGLAAWVWLRLSAPTTREGSDDHHAMPDGYREQPVGR